MDEEEKQEEIVEDNRQEELPKGKKERTELPENYEFANGCKSCKNYHLLLERDLFLPLNFQTNLPDPPGLSAPEKQKKGERIDFWVKHLKTGKLEVCSKEWYEENKKRWDLVHIKMTQCRFKRIYQHKVIDEVTKKELFKDYCAYWHKD